MTWPLGIMQGRLSPAGVRPQAFPRETWREEFRRARALGFAALEWLVDDPADNPLLDARASIRAVEDETGVRARTVCAHAFIDGALSGDAPARRRAALERLCGVMEAAAAHGAEVVVLPALEGASVRGAAGARARLTEALRALPAAGPRLALETDLPADEAAAVVRDVGRPDVGLCYDVGNATACGFDAPAELRALGPAVLEVHIKDRRRGGGPTGPLGQGDTPLAAVFAALRELRFAGPIVLETPVLQDWRAQAAANLAHVRGWL